MQRCLSFAGATSITLSAAALLLQASPARAKLNSDVDPSGKSVQRSATAVSHLDTPCRRGEIDRRSDLCAQWKAADAATEGVKWTERGFYVGLATAIVSALTLLSAIAAAYFARQAAHETRRSADEAKRSAKAAIDSAESARTALHSDRAWMISDQIITYHIINGMYNDEKIEDGLGFSVRWTNRGKTPALRVGLKIAVSLHYNDGTIEWLYEGEDVDEGSRVSVVGPDGKIASSVAHLNDRQTAAFRQRFLSLKIICTTTYNDIYGDDLRHTRTAQRAEHQGGQSAMAASLEDAKFAEAINFSYIEGQYAT